MAAPNMNGHLHLADAHQNSPASFEVLLTLQCMLYAFLCIWAGLKTGLINSSTKNITFNIRNVLLPVAYFREFFQEFENHLIF